MKKRGFGIAISYLYYVLNIVLTIFINAFIVRVVGQTNHGVYQTVTAFVSYLILLEFGTGTIMVRNISLVRGEEIVDKDKLKKNIGTIWFLCLILSLIIIGCLVGFYFLISPIYHESMSAEQIVMAKQIFIFAGISLLFSFLTQTLEGVQMGYKYFSFGKAVLLVKLLIRVGLVVALLLVRNDVILVSIIDAGVSILAFIAMLLFCIFKTDFRPTFKNIDWRIFKSIIPLALALLIQTLANTANGTVDKFFIGVFMTPEDVSIYSIAVSLFMTFSAISSLSVSIYVPKNAEDIKKGLTGVELTDSIVAPCRLNTVISGIVLTGFLLVGREFIQIVYGATYLESWIYAIVIMIPLFFYNSTSIIENVVDLMGKRYIRSLIILGTTILNIGLTIGGIALFGMIGAAVATAIVLILNVIILSIWYSKYIKLKMTRLYLKMFLTTIPFMVVAGLCALPFDFFVDNIWLKFFIQGSIVVIVFFALFIPLGLSKSEKSLVVSLFKRKGHQ